MDPINIASSDAPIIIPVVTSDSLLYMRSLFLTLETVLLNMFMDTVMVMEKVTAIAISVTVAATPRLTFLLIAKMCSLA